MEKTIWWKESFIRAVLKSEKYRRYDIFHSGCLCCETAQTSCDPIGENAFAYFSSGAALTSGMVGKSEKYRRYDIFHSGCLCCETAQTSCDPIGENAFAYFSSGAALASGMVGKSEKYRSYDIFHSGCLCRCCHPPGVFTVSKNRTEHIPGGKKRV